jgi:hypothetical protein
MKCILCQNPVAVRKYCIFHYRNLYRSNHLLTNIQKLNTIQTIFEGLDEIQDISKLKAAINKALLIID